MLLSEVAAVTGGKLKGNCNFNKFCIDSRKVKKGDIFVCFKGARVDGHEYISQALEAGAVGFLCEKSLNTDAPYLVVPSSVQALQQFASHYRDLQNIKVVAITGSVGKTTTKECIYSVLSEKFKTHKTYGNMNSETGLPLTLLDIAQDDEMAVTEMGMSGFGEIDCLSRTAKPDIAVITNIGMSHIEMLGSQENILKAKLEILNGLKEDGILILNGDDKFLMSEYNNLKKNIGQSIITYGINNPECDVRAQEIVLDEGYLRFLAVTPCGERYMEVPCEGLHNVYNSLAAVTVGIACGMELKQISKGLLKFQNAPMRQQIYEKNGFNIIEDCYNASPASMKAAFDILKCKKNRKIAVLGDMLELGGFSEKLHYNTGCELKGIDILIAFGNYNDSYIKGAIKAGINPEFCFSCADAFSAGEKLSKIAKPGDYMLVKASRGMCGENVVKKFFDMCKGENV